MCFMVGFPISHYFTPRYGSPNHNKASPRPVAVVVVANILAAKDFVLELVMWILLGLPSVDISLQQEERPNHARSVPSISCKKWITRKNANLTFIGHRGERYIFSTKNKFLVGHPGNPGNPNQSNHAAGLAAWLAQIGEKPMRYLGWGSHCWLLVAEKMHQWNPVWTY